LATRVDETGDPAALAPGHLRAKVFHGGVYLFLRQFISLGLSLAGVFVITRLIGPAPYGAYVAASGIYQFLLNLGEVGILVYLVRQPGDLAEHEYHVASTVLVAAGLFQVVLVEAGAGLLTGWVQVEGFEQLLRVLILVLPIQLLAIAACARLERRLDYRRVAGIEFFGQVSYYCVSVPLAFAGHGARALVTGWIVQQIATSAVFHLYAGYLPRLRVDTAIARKMLSYTLSFSLVTWTWQLRALVNPLLVGHFLGATAVGQIGITIRIVEVLTFVKAIAWRLSVAALARIQHDKEKVQEAITLGIQLQTLALGPVLLGFGWLGTLFLPRLLGAPWSPVVGLFPFIAASYLTNAQFSMHSSALAVFRKNYQITAFHIVHIALFTAGVAICVPAMGLLGYGWGELIAFPSYYVIHYQTTRIVGSIGYRIAAIWWVGVILGLFWHQLGIWAILMPFIALMWPESVMELRALYRSFRPVVWRSIASE
jgi:PST family polysaccharide transporter